MRAALWANMSTGLQESETTGVWESRVTMAEDYYKVLGINRNASEADIQKAYHQLARKYHPDLNPDDQNAKRRFQKVQRAFDDTGTPFTPHFAPARRTPAKDKM